MACAGGELFCALGFTFLRGEASSLRGGVSPRGYWFKTWRERFDWTRHSGVTVFPSARGSKNRYPAEGVSPRAWSRRPSACVWRSGYWFTTWRERSDWTRTSEAKIFRAREEPKIFASAYRSLLLWTRTRRSLEQAPQRLRMAEWLLIHDSKRMFRLDSNQRGEDFPSARGTKNLCIRLQIPVALDSNQTEPGAGAPAPAYGGVVTGSSQRNR